MMRGTEYEPFTVRVPKTFTWRFAAVFTPRAIHPDGKIKHSMVLPADDLPTGMAEWLGSWSRYGGWRPLVREREDVEGPFMNASSLLRPLVQPGTGMAHHLEWWKHQLEAVDRLNLPRDWLLSHLALEALVQPFEWDRGAQGHGLSLTLKTIRVVDPSDEEPLRRLMQTTNEAFMEAQRRA